MVKKEGKCPYCQDSGLAMTMHRGVCQHCEVGRSLYERSPIRLKPEKKPRLDFWDEMEEETEND